MSEVVVGGIYRHFKGNEYRVVAVGKHSETLEDLIVYEALYDNITSKIWCRPKDLFLGNVELDGQSKKRFEHIG